MIYYYVISNFYLNSPIGVGALFLYCFVLAVPGDIVLCIVAAIIGKRMIPLIRGRETWIKDEQGIFITGTGTDIGKRM